MWGKPAILEETITCSLVKAPTVYLEPIARQKIQVLMGEYPHQEWLAYLRGRISEKNNIFVEEISVPPHEEASAGSAEAEPLHIPKDCVGVIHSHHTMGAFHSGTDKAYVDKNFPVSITVAKNGEGLTYDAVCCSRTSCGKDLTLKSTVKYVQPQLLFDKDEFLKEAKANIDKNKAVWVQPRYEGYGGYACYDQHLNPYRRRAMGKQAAFGDMVVFDQSGNVIPKSELDDIKYNSIEV